MRRTTYSFGAAVVGVAAHIACGDTSPGKHGRFLPDVFCPMFSSFVDYILGPRFAPVADVPAEQFEQLFRWRVDDK